MITRKAGKFGKAPPKIRPETPRLKSYLTPELPTPPPTVDTLTRMLTTLGKTVADIPALFPMNGNDTIGDCVASALAHDQTMFRGMIGHLAIWGQADVERFYFSQTGGQDTGLVIADTLHYWHTHPLNGDRILAYALVDHQNHVEVMQALSLFGRLFTGFQVTDQTVSQFEHNQPWTPGTLIGEGHAIDIVEYTSGGVQALTWGSVTIGEWAWWDQGVDECWIVIPPEAESLKFDGINLQQLIADMHALAA